MGFSTFARWRSTKQVEIQFETHILLQHYYNTSFGNQKVSVCKPKVVNHPVESHRFHS
jgi:hypothetical protein